MGDSCSCAFCKDYNLFKKNIELVPVEIREWLENLFENRWTLAEDLSYREAIISGDWPDSVSLLERYLARAKEKQAKLDKVCPDPEIHKQVAESEVIAKQLEKECEVMEAEQQKCGVVDPAPVDSAVRPFHGPCDDCGEGMMVERTNSINGYTFLGCSEFPECKFTKNGGKNPAPPRASFCLDDYLDDYLDDDYNNWDDDFQGPL